MRYITPDQITPQLLSLFDPRPPVSLRRLAVLSGLDPGKILTNDPQRPGWAAVWEAGDGILYLGGQFDTPLLGLLITTLRNDGDVLVGFWSNEDPLVSLLPHDFDWAGSSIDFLDRPGDGSGLEAYLRPLPPGHRIQEIDPVLFERCLWYEDTLRRHGSLQAFLEQGKGFCLTNGDDILSEAYAGKVINGVRELGAITQEQARGRGYATITCAHLIRACEGAGERTYWNCATANYPSVALARKLGYQTEMEFHWWAWSHRG